MSEPKLTVLEILRHLNKSNCRACGVPTCMAFAASVLQGQKQLADCPDLDEQAALALSLRLDVRKAPDEDPARALEPLKRSMQKLDLGQAAKRLGLAMVNGRLRVHVLGRVFDVDNQGDLHTMCHVNNWVHAPLLNYILSGQGKAVCGQWTPYAELEGTRDWVRFFTHRCENALQRLADCDPDLLFDMLDVLGKRTGRNLTDADLSVSLMPFPNVPILFSYWRAEGDFESRLALHFDRTATANLDARSIFFVVTGLTEMLTRFSQTHGR